MFKYFLIFISFSIFSPTILAEQQFVCRTKQFIVIIDYLPSRDLLRYRSWNKPKRIQTRPSLELYGNPVNTSYSEGTGVCRYTTWNFTKRNFRYVVEEESPCGETPPKITGTLSVYENGNLILTQSCVK